MKQEFMKIRLLIKSQNEKYSFLQLNLIIYQKIEPMSGVNWNSMGCNKMLHRLEKLSGSKNGVRFLTMTL